jgi:hypothetical protein
MSRKRDRAKTQKRLEWFLAQCEINNPTFPDEDCDCHDCHDGIYDYDDDYDDDDDYRDGRDYDEDIEDDFDIDDSPICLPPPQDNECDSDDIPF